jgi:hypothetical protein
MRRSHLAVLDVRAHLVSTRAPRHDAVVARVDRGHGNRERNAVSLGDFGFDGVEIEALAAVRFGGERVLRAADDRASERDDPLDEIGALACDFARDDAAEAPPDQSHTRARRVEQLRDRSNDFRRLRANVAGVAAEAPAARIVPEHREIASQHERRGVARAEPRQHDDGLAVAARLEGEARARQQESRNLEHAERLAHEPEARRRRDCRAHAANQSNPVGACAASSP